MSRSYSRGKVTVGPVIKAQLPKINFDQVQKQQQFMEDVLKYQSNYADSREVASNIINQKHIEHVDRSFDEQQHSYHLLREKLNTASNLFQTRVVQKASAPKLRNNRSSSRGAGNSMVLQVKDELMFQWMDDMHKKTHKSSLMKPARNPQKVNESMTRTRLQMRPPKSRQQVAYNLSTIEVAKHQQSQLEDEDINFELQGLNTNKNLKNYDCYEESQTPEQIVMSFQHDSSHHAKSPLFIDNTYIWSEVKIISYDQQQEKYEVLVLRTNQIKFVNRLSLWLKTESEQEFKKRLYNCKQLQKQAEEELRFYKYVNSLSDDIPTQLSQAVKNRVKEQLTKVINKQGVSTSLLQLDLFEQMEYEYMLFMKKFNVLLKMGVTEEQRDFIENRIKIRYIQDLQMPIPAKRELVKKDFNQTVDNLRNVNFLMNKQVMKAHLRVTSRVTTMDTFKLMTTKFNYGQLPFSLANFEAANQITYQQNKLNLTTVWRQFTIQDIQDALRYVYNFYQTDFDVYMSSELHKLLKKFDMIFSQIGIENVLENNIRVWVTFLQQFTMPTDSQWVIPTEPLLVLNIVCNQLQRKKTTIYKQKSKLEHEEVIVFEPEPTSIIQILTNPIELIKDAIQSLIKIEKDLIPLLDIPIERVIDIDQYAHLFKEAEDKIIGYINQGLEEPIRILNSFQEYSYIFTKSVNQLMKRLFGESKEKPCISNLDLDKIKEKIQFYSQSIRNIQRLCVDEKVIGFFQIRTKQVKSQLVTKGSEILNQILQRTAEIVTDNIQRISKQYQDMCDKMIEQPRNEVEMVNLKNYIAEAEINLAKVLNDVGLLRQCLDMFEEQSYSYNIKEIENYWLLMQWPYEIRVSIIEGQRIVNNQECKFTEQLENEKDIFIRELSQIELGVVDIKQYDNYLYVKESASGVMGLKDKFVFAQDKVKSFNDRENLFKQPLTEYDDLTRLLNEFDPYYKIWDLAMEFDSDKQEWYFGSFIKMSYPPIERKILQYYIKEIMKLNKHFQDVDDDRALKVLYDFRQDIDKFKDSMWVIELLTIEAIQKKPQVWKEVFEQFNMDMDISDEMTLTILLDQGIEQHRQKVEEISRKTAQQWDIEKKIAMLIERVKDIRLQFVLHQDTFILKSTDEIQQQLDDQLSNLIMLKASPYIKPIINKANQIEIKILLIQDTLENWVKTQRGWMYLEPIFISDDIRKKLPTEKHKFDIVDKYWRTTMDIFSKEPLLWEGIDSEKHKNDSANSNRLLDEIQQSLSEYLDQKRKYFPRFFFLPDDGLLEILAQTKNPLTVQKHINKCFEGVNELDFRQSEEVVMGMLSAESEYIEFYRSVNVNEGDKRGNVEKWLLEIEQIMMETIKRLMYNAYADDGNQRSDWVLQQPAQCALAINMVRWTQRTESTILAQYQQDQVNEYVAPSLQYLYNQLKDEQQQIVTILQSNLTQQQRILLSSLIVLDVHNRDIIESLQNKENITLQSFDWICNLRYYYIDKKLTVGMINASVNYGYEYLGNTTRLVITPLTDRCYRTLLGAFLTNYGGAPEGPAGTGKTETVKDLSKAIAIRCVVFNCSEGLNHLSMSKFFKGLASSGAWCCFDEFNRIDLEVLSVIASQIQTIQTAIRERKKIFYFENDEYTLISSCCINITMNPGYAGRSTLPDNLKALFRPCAMMVPDYKLIAAIYLYSVGVQLAEQLADKIVASLKLSSEQLSCQDHYDFGMRALKAILQAAGRMKQLHKDEQEVCLRALIDVNLPKFTENDIPLFMSIISDLFPGIALPNNHNNIEHQLIEECNKLGLICKQQFKNKCVQLHDTIAVRHGLMNVGQAFSGKSSVVQCLSKVHHAQVHKLNPKAVTNEQLYGKLDPTTRGWNDGIIALIMRNVYEQVNKPQWIVFDGPVDAVWIENMNTVLDDNKKLCLTSGEIIKLNQQTTMMFEVADLAQASPATVSRCGMVYFEPQSLSWVILLETFKNKHKLTEIFDKKAKWLFDVMLTFTNKHCNYPIYYSGMAFIQSTLQLFSSYLPFKSDEQMINMLLFCALWGIGGAIDEDSRKALNDMLLKLVTASAEIIIQYQLKLEFPYEAQALQLKLLEQNARPNLFEMIYDVTKGGWMSWTATQQLYQLPQNAQYHDIIIPMNDSIRNDYLFNKCIEIRRHFLLAGPTGTGKTLNMKQQINQKYFNKDCTNLQTTFSGQSTANQIQRLIESRITQRRCKGHLGPEDGKNLCVVFIDDLNMPQPEEYGAQPPIEIIRQWMDYGGWYDLDSKEFKYLEDIVFVGAMLPRNAVTHRLLRHFTLLYAQPLSNESLNRIFNTTIQWIVMNLGTKQNLSKQVQNIAQQLPQATIELYNKLQKDLLPTPQRSHYTYNLRDISKVFQGISKCDIRGLQTQQQLIRLWYHECTRVFADRLINISDINIFQNILNTTMNNFIDKNTSISDNLYFASFVPTPDENNKQQNDLYCQISSIDTIRQKCQELLVDYNFTVVGKLDMVLFDFAIQHLLRVVRVLQTVHGHLLLVGVGGSGRKTISTLGSFIALSNDLQTVVGQQIVKEWNEQLQLILRLVGIDQKPTAVLFSDTTVTADWMFEQISHLLNNAEVPNLYNFEERAKLLEELSQLYDGTPQEKIQKFVGQCKLNLHCIVCMSQVGDSFRSRLRTFPSLVNCTTIDWFMEWPKEALQSVATLYLNQHAECQQITSICINMQESIQILATRYLTELRQHYYITPTSFINLMKLINRLIGQQTQLINNQIQRYHIGVERILSTESDVAVIRGNLQDLQPKLHRSTLENSHMLINLQKKQKEADLKKQQCLLEEQECNIQREKANDLRNECQYELDKVLPILAQASEALEKITNDDMNQLKSFQKPPTAASKVMEGLCYVFNEDQNVKLRPKEPGSFEKIQDFWEYAKKNLLNDKLIKRVKNFKEDQIKAISDAKIKKLKIFIQDADFQRDKVFNASKAAGNLSLWVRAVVDTYDAFTIVDPKKAYLQIAVGNLDKAEAQLKDKKEVLGQILHLLSRLEDEYRGAKQDKEYLEKEVERCVVQLERAEKLMSGLSHEKESWKQKANQQKENTKYILGDCLLSCGIISYLGVFPMTYRHEAILEWKLFIEQQKIVYSPQFGLAKVLSDPIVIGVWVNQQKLPNDHFSIENAVIIKNTQQPVLIIDPQGQANQWLKQNAIDNGQKVVMMKQSQTVQEVEMILENALQCGYIVLLEDIGERIPSAYDTILRNDNIRHTEEQSAQFRLYITTKLQQPHYSPEICIQVTLLNFMITQEGLEDQLLNIIVKTEEPLKEEQRVRNIKDYYENKNKQRQTEDLILKLLSGAGSNLLEDELLINTLQKSKIESIEIDEKLKKSEHDQYTFNNIRNQYRATAKITSHLYQVITDLAKIQPIYVWSLEFYISLYIKAIKESLRDNRNQRITELFKQLLYINICRSLMEDHKLLFSFLMQYKLHQVESIVTAQELRFLLVGSMQSNLISPYSWLSNQQWNNLSELSSLFVQFKQLLLDIESDTEQWELMIQHDQFNELPIQVNEFSKLQLIKILRPDLFVKGMREYITNNLGAQYVDPPAFNLELSFEQSSPSIPIIFILSPGADPRIEIQSLAEKQKIHLLQLSLGQGQEIAAEKAIIKAIYDGKWVLLQNCHLAISFMSALEKIYQSEIAPLTQGLFRLWLTTAPSANFPVSLLQKGIKLTYEAPRGLKNNLLRLYQSVDPKRFEDCTKQYEYKKLLFGLSFFHSIVIERRKFGPQGWNIPYEFTQADFSISQQQLKIFLDQQEKIPFDALNYLVSQTNYGGRVTDPNDQKLLSMILRDYYTPEILLETHRFGGSTQYYAPSDGPLQSYIEFIQQLPQYDAASIFGLHPNAEISSAILETDEVCQTILSLLPRHGQGQNSTSDLIKSLSNSLLIQLPTQFNLEKVALKYPIQYQNSMNTVLIQEIQRFHKLTNLISSTLIELIKAIEGTTIMSTDLEIMSYQLLDNTIPSCWLKISYPTSKQLGGYIKDLVQRLEFFQKWIQNGAPIEYWISAFYFTQSFLTGIQQNYSRKYQIPIDSLTFEFSYIDFYEQQTQPQDGCYIYGLHFDGAKWDSTLKIITEPDPFVLYSPVPRIWLLPSQNTQQYEQCYLAPIYKTPKRTGTLSTTGHSTNYVMSAQVPCQESSEFWVKRGMAILTQLND